jgi:hypothetical protein
MTGPVAAEHRRGHYERMRSPRITVEVTQAAIDKSAAPPRYSHDRGAARADAASFAGSNGLRLAARFYT